MTIIQDAIDDLIGLFKNKENYTNFFTSLMAPLEEIEAAADYLIDNRNIDTAPGVWLDNCGKIVGIPRSKEEEDEANIFKFGLVSEGALVESQTTTTLTSGLTQRFTDCIQYGNKIYCYPYNLTDVYVFNLDLEVINYVGSVATGAGVPITDACVGIDGNIYLCPGYATSFYRINTTNDTLETIGSTSGNRYSAVLHSDGVVYYAPGSSLFQYFAAYDIVGDTLTLSFSGVTDGGYGAAFESFGDYLYAFPGDASCQKVIKINKSTGAVTQVGASITPAVDKFMIRGIKYGKYLFAVPVSQTMPYFYAINTDNDAYSQVGGSLASLISGDSWASTLGEYNGKIYAYPRNMETLICLDAESQSWNKSIKTPTITDPGVVISQLKDGIFYGHSPSTEDLLIYDVEKGYEKIVEKEGTITNSSECATFMKDRNTFFSFPRGNNDEVKKIAYSYTSTYFANGFANIVETIGGFLFSKLNNYTEVDKGDIEYRTLILAKANATFRGSSIRDIVDWIYDSFGVVCKVEFVEFSDVKITPDTPVSYDIVRFIHKYAPVSAGSKVVGEI